MVQQKLPYEIHDQLSPARQHPETSVKLQPRSRKNGPDYIGDRSWSKYETEHLQWQNDTYFFSNTGNAFFSDANVYLIQNAFQRRMIEKYNINPGRQDPFWVTEMMHETFYWFFNLQYHKMHARMGSNAVKDLISGYEFNPAENEERGIIYRREWQKNVREKQFRQDLPVLSIRDIIRKMNAHVLDTMEEEAYEKVATWKNYHKHWNSSIYEKMKYTNYSRLPEDEGINANRKPASRNLFRVKPVTFYEDSHMFDHINQSGA